MNTPNKIFNATPRTTTPSPSLSCALTGEKVRKDDEHNRDSNNDDHNKDHKGPKCTHAALACDG